MLRKSFAVLCCVAGIGAFLAGAYYLVMDAFRYAPQATMLFTAGLVLVALYMFLTRRN